MSARIAAILALVGLAGSLLHAGSPAAHACSGPDLDVVAFPDVIAGGEITGYERMGPPNNVNGFVTIRVDLRVEHVWKGSIAGRPIIDGTSLMEHPDGTIWAGASGACGAFDKDPTGNYVVFGLRALDDGTLQSNRLLLFYLADRPYDAAEVTARVGLGLPIAGNPSREDRSGLPLLLAPLVAAAGVALVAGGRRLRAR